MRSVTSSHFTAEKTETRRPWLPQGPRAEAETGARLCSPIPWPRRHRPPGRPGPGRRGLVSPWSLTSVEAAARRPRTVLCSDPCPHILLVCPIDLLSFSPPLAPRWAPGFSFIQVAPESKASSQGRCPCPARSLSLSLFFQRQPLCPGAVASANKWVTTVFAWLFILPDSGAGGGLEAFRTNEEGKFARSNKF